MADTIKAIGDLFEKFGWAIGSFIIILAMLVILFLFGVWALRKLFTTHIDMLQDWKNSNSKLAEASENRLLKTEERLMKTEQRSETFMVANLNLQKGVLDATASQNTKLDAISESQKELVKATINAASKVEEQSVEAKNQTELLSTIAEGQQEDREWRKLFGSNPMKLCRAETIMKKPDEEIISDMLAKFPGINRDQAVMILANVRNEKG